MECLAGRGKRRAVAVRRRWRTDRPGAKTTRLAWLRACATGRDTQSGGAGPRTRPDDAPGALLIGTVLPIDAWGIMPIVRGAFCARVTWLRGGAFGTVPVGRWADCWPGLPHGDHWPARGPRYAPQWLACAVAVLRASDGAWAWRRSVMMQRLPWATRGRRSARRLVALALLAIVGCAPAAALRPRRARRAGVSAPRAARQRPHPRRAQRAASGAARARQARRAGRWRRSIRRWR